VANARELELLEAAFAWAYEHGTRFFYASDDSTAVRLPKLTRWPIGDEPVFCSMRDGETAGVFVVSRFALPWLDRKEFTPVAVLMHELAHTLAGEDEEIVSAVERAVARHIKVGRRLLSDLIAYSGCYNSTVAEVRWDLRGTLLLRASPHWAPGPALMCRPWSPGAP
jgi:hypothetical protein